MKRTRTDEDASSNLIELPDPQAPAPNLAPELGFTAQDLIDQQEQLESEAASRYPFQIDTCTYSLGAIRQPIYSCQTCGGGGVCSGCSVVCHGDHKLIELFHKRDFRCDCGTPSINLQSNQEDVWPPEQIHPCLLRKNELNRGIDPENDNSYSHNFQGHFCCCERGKSYDPQTEEETMYQCLVCEDWYHESCTVLGTSPPLNDEMFEHLICDACVQRTDADLLRQYAGAKGWMFFTHQGPESWDGVVAKQCGRMKLYGDTTTLSPSPSSPVATQLPEAQDTLVEVADAHGLSPDTKRSRISCTAPKKTHPAVLKPSNRLDLFISASFRQRLCECADCIRKWKEKYPYVLEEEQSYDPAVDANDAHSTSSSTYDLGVAALGRLPRVQMLESLRAYQDLKEALYDRLRPFAERKQVVDEETVRTFFREHEERRGSPSKDAK
ncbi:RING-type E3 ubiquitin transferase [Malassezia yamatoensis]|uniref:RING-type E3 ubiquitin transferase n=1 Tax=Malassezia yamatoensis TaxID=253288 RepID=A0AAJ5YWH0_9BASI|nr:RING-type E3 ubiquitin transferase [Malassezia yamatoensis]